MTQVIAHRTCPLEAPENSREGVRVAASQHADAVEIDLRLSRDAVPILCHDPLLLRTTWWPLPVKWSSAKLLTSRRLRGSTETVPRFTDILAILPDGLDMALDVKDPTSMTAAIEAASQANLLARMRLWSSSPDAVATARALAPDQQRALLRNTSTPESTMQYLRDAAAKGANAVSVMDISVSDEVVHAAHDLGLWVNAWVRTLDVQDNVLSHAPDSIVTDWVVQARDRLNAG